MGLGRVAIVSSAQTELRPAWSNAQHIDLISAVVTDVFKGSGLTIDDVDFIIDSGSDVLDGRSISNCGFLGALGAHHKEEARVEDDGLFAALYGVNKIRSGASRVGLIVAYSKPSESSVDAFWSTQVEPFYQRPVGFGQRAALGFQAQAYAAKHDAPLPRLAELTAARWEAARDFGGVELGELPSAEDIVAAEEGAAPLTRLMLSRPADGAVAMLIANEPIAKRHSAAPVWITGTGSSMDRHALASRDPSELKACQSAGAMALRNAGWSDAHADLAEISAPSAVAELMVLEALGISEAGRGLEAALGGETAVNRSGGALPADPIMATGLFRLAAAARQLREGTGQGRGIAHGAGGVGLQNNIVMTLEV